MTPGELELYATQDLIDELMRRTTFQGVVVHARDEVRTDVWDGERVFSVRHSMTLDVEHVGRLLDVVGRRLIASDEA